MNILLSGASGFIGSYFIDKFANTDISLDIISREKPTNLIDSNVEMYHIDITKPIECTLQKEYEYFIHLAGGSGVEFSPLDSVLKTTYGTRNCLDFCLKNNISKFIYFSTLQVYGENNIITEESNISCTNDYAITHYFAEEYVRMFRHQGIDFIILRPSNVYGDFKSETGKRWSLVPSCFCKAALENNKINLLSSGKQKRDFVCLEDVFRFTYHLINNFTASKNKVFNLASGDVYSILELAELVKERYELKYGVTCELVIESTIPLDGEDCSVSLNAMKNTGFKIHTNRRATMQLTIDTLLEG